MVSVYGSTEASLVATAPAQAIAHIAGAVGYVLPDISVEVVDAEDRGLNTGAEGRVRIGGAYHTNGYLGDREETASAFRDGWFYPGDIGYLSPDGILVITGREKTVLNVGGDKVKPETVEDAVLAFPGIEQAAAFQATNEFGVGELCVALIAPKNLNGEGLRAHCERQLPSACVPVRFRLVDNLPRNAMGKLEREKLSQIVGTELSNAGRR
jgi:acyl-CoA synthetase (AMP-forming)/AMP-acid ligase II